MSNPAKRCRSRPPPVVRDACLCLHVQRAARALARRFDEALRPLDLTNGQFSLLMSLNRPEPPSIGSVATLLAMDRTTLTAALKPLERRGLVKVAVDKEDRRSRLLDHHGGRPRAAQQGLSDLEADPCRGRAAICADHGADDLRNGAARAVVTVPDRDAAASHGARPHCCLRRHDSRRAAPWSAPGLCRRRIP